MPEVEMFYSILSKLGLRLCPKGRSKRDDGIFRAGGGVGGGGYPVELPRENGDPFIVFQDINMF